MLTEKAEIKFDDNDGYLVGIKLIASQHYWIFIVITIKYKLKYLIQKKI